MVTEQLYWRKFFGAASALYGCGLLLLLCAEWMHAPEVFLAAELNNNEIEDEIFVQEFSYEEGD